MLLRRAEPPRRPSRHRRRGFTLIELGIVVAIIGILVSLVLIASAEGVERARVRATQATITKLDTGITERLDAILSQRVNPNGAHEYLASLLPGTAAGPWGLTSDARAYVIAQHDLLKAELPDVFVVNTDDMEYPLNFAGLHYPDPTGSTPSAANRAGFVLPLGHLVGPPTGTQGFRPNSFAPGPVNLGPGANWVDTTTGLPVNGTTAAISSTGIYGASYNARGALNRLLGISPRGCDGVDNDGNGWIDELTPSETGMTAAEIAAVVAKLANHQHTTARSEVLYALLIGGQGPLGAIFTEEDFGPTEIGDTDGDGLPEFLDAWGKPLQFYRWPIHFSSPTGSSLQMGRRTYNGPIEARQTSSLDPNQLLIAPGWFMAGVNNGASVFPAAGPVSGRAHAFGLYFHSLVDFNIVDTETSLTDVNIVPGPGRSCLWERSGAVTSGTLNHPLAARRAYYTRPLIASGGPDGQLGLAQIGFNYGSEYSMPGGSQAPTNLDARDPSAALWVQIAENPATTVPPMRASFANTNGPYYPIPLPISPTVRALKTGLGDQTEGWNLDDITNQTIQNTAGGTGQ